ncbi:Uncharacterised protein [Mycobacterium tuberculosis]|nr:Uncharacterised protein [Mycobacterium tuberculosis]
MNAAGGGVGSRNQLAVWRIPPMSRRALAT